MIDAQSLVVLVFAVALGLALALDDVASHVGFVGDAGIAGFGAACLRLRVDGLAWDSSSSAVSISQLPSSSNSKNRPHDGNGLRGIDHQLSEKLCVICDASVSTAPRQPSERLTIHVRLNLVLRRTRLHPDAGWFDPWSNF
jgi:hypothetical protein